MPGLLCLFTFLSSELELGIFAHKKSIVLLSRESVAAVPFPTFFFYLHHHLGFSQSAQKTKERENYVPEFTIIATIKVCLNGNLIFRTIKYDEWDENFVMMCTHI